MCVDVILSFFLMSLFLAGSNMICETLNTQAFHLRSCTNTAEEARTNMCIYIAAVLKYRERESGIDVSESDVLYYQLRIKPVLEFIIFVMIYYPGKRLPFLHCLHLSHSHSCFSSQITF